MIIRHASRHLPGWAARVQLLRTGSRCFWTGWNSVTATSNSTTRISSGAECWPTRPSGVDCSGTLSFLWTGAYALSQGALPGQPVRAQFWYRDAAASFGVGLSDALHFEVLP